MSSSEARLIVVFRDGRGGHYERGFTYPVSPIRSARYELKDLVLEENGLSFLLVPTEEKTAHSAQICSLDILSGKVEINEI